VIRFFAKFSQSWFGPLIMGLIFIALGILGSGGMRNLQSPIQNSVVDAGSHSVGEAEFQKLFAGLRQSYEEREHQAYPLEEAVQAGEDKRLLGELADQKAYTEMLTRSGVQPSEDVLAVEMRRAAQSGQAPGLGQVFDPITGKFNEQALVRLLAEKGVSLEEFERDQRDQIAQQQFASAVITGFSTPRIYRTLLAAPGLESRDISYFVIPAAGVPRPSPPTDAQLNAFIQQSKMMLPELRTVTVVRFSAKALAPSMSVDPAAVAQQFKYKEKSYGRPETRSLVEIPLKDASAASAVRARLVRGDDPTAVAKSIGVDAISYADQPQSAVTDRKAAAAAFGLAEGQVSGPVQGDFRTVIVKVTKVTPGQAPSLEAARPQIEADLRQSEALDKVTDLSQKFEEARDGGASVADAAAKVGVAAISIGPVTADGRVLGEAGTNPLLSARLLKTAFSLSQGADSEVEQDDQSGEYYAVHIDRVSGPRLVRVDDPGAREALTQKFMMEAITSALKAKAASIQAAIAKGQSMAAAASGVGSQLVHQVDFVGTSAETYVRTFGEEVVVGLLRAKEGDLVTGLAPPLGGVVVARVDAARQADPAALAAFADKNAGALTQSYAGGLAAAIRDASVKMIKPRTDLALARKAMGVDDAMLAKVSKPGAKGAGLAQ
jgi:peptidyl-prolyl cis-trans isomerase D